MIYYLVAHKPCQIHTNNQKKFMIRSHKLKVQRDVGGDFGQVAKNFMENTTVAGTWGGGGINQLFK